MAIQPPKEEARANRLGSLPRWLIIVFAAYAAYRACSIALWSPTEALLARIPDDSLFYFQIAWNFADTLRFSYDRVHDTYGFQPLWQIVLGVCAFCFESREAFLRFGVLLLGLLHVAAGLLMFGMLRRWLGAVAAVASGAFWLLNPSLLDWNLGGKENALYALLLLSTLSCATGPGLARPLRAATGVRLGLLQDIRWKIGD